VADRKAHALIEQAEAKKLCDLALREIELGRSSFAEEISNLKKRGQGDAQECRHYAMAGKMLAKKRNAARADALT
jgi:hypothetical protein